VQARLVLDGYQSPCDRFGELVLILPQPRSIHLDDHVELEVEVVEPDIGGGAAAPAGLRTSSADAVRMEDRSVPYHRSGQPKDNAGASPKVLGASSNPSSGIRSTAPSRTAAIRIASAGTKKVI
jgi:hypothetical protein